MIRQTVFAMSSGAARAGVAVIRVSGPSALTIVSKLTRCVETLNSHKAVLRSFFHPRTEELLDRGIVLPFKAPKSFTGEDVVELHVHGGNAVVSNMLQALGELPDLRPAEPGEFTKRAFMNDKLDLTQVEALADLINADTEWQRRQALHQMQGSLRNLYDQWRKQLISCLAMMEAILDFGESDEVDEGTQLQVKQQVRNLSDSIRLHLSRRHGEIIRNGINMTILGPPNAGKSSLLNILAMRQASIVSPIPGTTRDVIQVNVNIDGFPVILYDTAGLRDTLDMVEQEGVRRAREKIDLSDIRLCVLDASNLNDDIAFEKVKDYIDQSTLVILNKQDILSNELDLCTLAKDVKQRLNCAEVFLVSCTTGEGLPGLVRGIGATLRQRFDMEVTNNNVLALTQTRHRVHLNDCLQALDNILTDTCTGDLVLEAEELRQAAKSLGRITGAVDVEQILDVIFRDFCIGK